MNAMATWKLRDRPTLSLGDSGSVLPPTLMISEAIVYPAVWSAPMGDVMYVTPMPLTDRGS
jgi:hypothetical protein